MIFSYYMIVTIHQTIQLYESSSYTDRRAHSWKMQDKLKNLPHEHDWKTWKF